MDRVYLPGQKNPIALRPNSPELYLLAMARDEAHRFANRGRKKVGKRRRFASRLDEVPGIGPKTRTALLTALGSVDGIRRANDADVLAVKGIARRHLEALRKYLGREDDAEGDADDGLVEDDAVEGTPPPGNAEAAPASDNQEAPPPSATEATPPSGDD